MLKKMFLSSVMAVTSVVFTTGAMAASGVTTGNLNLRTGPSTAHAVATTIPHGGAVDINGCLANRAWCSVNYNGVNGWSSARYLNPVNVAAVPVVTASYKVVRPTHVAIVPQSSARYVAATRGVVVEDPSTRQNAVLVNSLEKINPMRLVAPAANEQVKVVRPTSTPGVVQVSDGISHKVNAYNPLFPQDVNNHNFYRNETRYDIVRY
ncbi:SH3 domain-containing protein [Bartonella tamiae]|nr:SH3 domain-containing protein [Bartonella tamiae]